MKNMDFRNADFFDTIVTQKIEGTELLLARKKTILPERKIIVEKYEAPSLIQYQEENKERFERAASGILLSR